MQYLSIVRLRALSLATLLAAPLWLTGCATAPEPLTPKAGYQEFTDVTWRPETHARAPMRANEMSVSALEAYKAGLWSFHDTHSSNFYLTQTDDGAWTAHEKIDAAAERCISWGTGADTLFRKGRPCKNEGVVHASPMSDGRLLLQNSGATPFNVAVELRAFNVSGKPIRHFLRNSNNQPDSLAWFVRESDVFPKGSTAYLATYWLGDDEILRPSKTAFTGADTLEKLMRQFSGKIPYCMSYISHQGATRYGIRFTPRRGKALEGGFELLPVKSSNMFCEAESGAVSRKGTWRITTIQGTRVLELIPESNVEMSDLGVQPVNRQAVGVGFAEILTGKTKRVVPVRIIRNNQPLTDFRLKFNRTAADSIAAALDHAARSKDAHDTKLGLRASKR